MSCLLMTDKAKFLSKFHDKCPYCERPFRKSKRKHVVDSKTVNKWFCQIIN